ncbi:nuclear transport factor 2 family protein [Novosphingobium sp. ZW T3_23]|uniref:nuclear transport factor 2 family protein n=1 Tax=Novosphingobium sp. ZW T3_23 TaxID=3378084 RepID=UPI0038552407
MPAIDVEQELAALKASVQHIMDRQDILDVIVRESRGRDRHDEELTAGCYWPEGADEHGPVPFPALEYPAKANRGHAAFFAMNQHNLANHSCEIDGDTAYCETYVIGTLLSQDGLTCTMAAGRYMDQMERRGGEWRILWRRSTVEAAIQGDASWLHTAAVKGFLKGTRDRGDLSYARPFEVGAPGARW